MTKRGSTQRIRTRFGRVDSYSTGNPAGRRVLIVPGYSETLAHARKLVDELGKLGMFAAAISQPRKSRQRKIGDSAKRDALERQADVLTTMLDRLAPGVKITAIGHSMGAAAVLKAAQQQPDRFERIILEQPLGFGHKQSFGEQLRRVTWKVVRNQWRALFGQGSRRNEDGYRAALDEESSIAYSVRVGRAQVAAGLLLASNVVLSLNEARAAGGYDASGDLEKVIKLGIPVHIIGAHADELFESKELDDTVMPPEGGIRAPLSYPADRRAGHDTFWMQPKLHAAIIDSIGSPWVARKL